MWGERLVTACRPGAGADLGRVRAWDGCGPGTECVTGKAWAGSRWRLVGWRDE